MSFCIADDPDQSKQHEPEYGSDISNHILTNLAWSAGPYFHFCPGNGRHVDGCHVRLFGRMQHRVGDAGGLLLE